MSAITFTLNGASFTVETDATRPLLDVLRNDLGLTGTKQGCDYEGECGACTVLLDGQPVRSCLTPFAKVAGRRVETVEGLSPSPSPLVLHPLQSAFIECGAVQCGFCTPGMLMAAKALLDREPDPTDVQIVDALEGNLCRCTGYVKIIAAVRLAADRVRDLPLTLLRHAQDRRCPRARGHSLPPFLRGEGEKSFARTGVRSSAAACCAPTRSPN